MAEDRTNSEETPQPERSDEEWDNDIAATMAAAQTARTNDGADEQSEQESEPSDEHADASTAHEKGEATAPDTGEAAPAEDTAPPPFHTDVPELMVLVSNDDGKPPDDKRITQLLSSITTDNIRERMKDPAIFRAVRWRQVIEDLDPGQPEFAKRTFERTASAGDVFQRDTDDKKAVRPGVGGSSKMNMIAALHGLRILYLYNSGFWITVRPPSIAQLSMFYNSVDLESEELGRVLGGLFYVVSDAHIKRQFMEFLPSIVVGSNLIGWDREDGTLEKSIAMQDLPTILWGVTSLMYRDDTVKIPMACFSEECNYKVSDVPVDLSKLRVRNSSALTYEDIQYTQSRTERTPQELAKYRSQDHFQQLLQYPNGRVNYLLGQCTLPEWIDNAEAMVTDIGARLEKGRGDIDERKIIEMALNYGRMFAPWVRRVSVCETPGKDAEVLQTSEDRESIMMTLEADVIDDERFAEDLDEFIGRTKTSWFAYTTIHCPQCGAAPVHGSVDEFTFVDVAALFFSLACRKLGLVETEK